MLWINYIYIFRNIMADPASYRPAAGSIPTSPGVYKFRDSYQQVIYVGKAKNLRARLANYFAELDTLHTRTRQMVTTATSVEWTIVTTEVEALQLEYSWIKEFDPHFNVRYRDDKTYPLLAITMNEEFPRVFVYRGPRRKGVRYFGPYPHVWAIRETVDLLTKVFPMRTCSSGVFKRHNQLGRPCLLGYIEKCAAPCTGAVSAAEHRAIVDDFADYLSGKPDKLVKERQREMVVASEELNFERAARLRDQLAALTKASERQAVVFTDETDADVVASVADDLELSLQIFHIRGGRIRGQRGWIVERTGDSFPVDSVIPSATPDELAEFLGQFYSGEGELLLPDAIPKVVYVEELPSESLKISEFLANIKGAPVEIKIPQRGDKKILLETVRRNAAEALAQQKLKRVGDLTERSAALLELQQALGLDSAPLRIECIDISHVQGTDVVGSLVVFEDGLVKKSEYRHYAIKEAAGEGHSDDVASIAEVTRRRFLRTIAPEAETVPTAKPTRFAYPPNLFVVDGGAPQVHAAAAVLEELGIEDVAVIGLAKRLEEVWMPGDDEPVILPRNSAAMFLLQRIRDEAHRFAINFHRSKRSQRMTESVLDSVPGLGPTRRTALVTHFGSVAKLKSATSEQVQMVPGIGPALAQQVLTALNAHKEESGTLDSNHKAD